MELRKRGLEDEVLAAVKAQRYGEFPLFPHSEDRSHGNWIGAVFQTKP